MAIMRTPNDRFANLEGFSITPRHTEVDGGRLGPLRIAHAEMGADGAPVVLCLHGEPSWSYLYRRMLPLFAKAGARALAPDLIGFGRSDKPSEIADYSYEGHVDWMLQWFDAQDLNGVTLFCQDWGGLIGLRLVAARPDRFARLVISNSFLPTGETPASEGFLRWRAYSQKVPVFEAGAIVHGGTARGISDAAKAAYDAPFPDESYKAGARAFPLLVPTSPDMPGAAENRAAWTILEQFQKPVLTLFGDSDPVTKGADRILRRRIPGAKGQKHAILRRVGHFSQEDAGPVLARRTLAFMAATGGLPG